MFQHLQDYFGGGNIKKYVQINNLNPKYFDYHWGSQRLCVGAIVIILGGCCW